MARAFLAASSQYISVPSAAPLNLGADDFAIAFWCRFPTAPPTDSAVVHKRINGFDGGQGWEFAVTNGTTGAVRWDVQVGAIQLRATATIATLSDGEWHHIVLDHTNNTPSGIMIYYDGTLVGAKTGSTNGVVDTVTPMTIGAAYNTPTTAFINGELAELALFKRMLSAEERTLLLGRFAPTTLRPLPVAYFPLIGWGPSEIDPIGGTIGSLVNAPAAAVHPPTILNEPPFVGQDTWYESIAAQIDGQSVVAANLTANAPVSAVIVGQSGMAASMSADSAVAAKIDGQSSLAATAALDKHIRSTIHGQSAIVAKASYDAAVATTIAAQSAVAADIETDAGASATIAAQSSLTASGSRARTAQAHIDGQGAMVAAATADHGLDSSIDGQGALAASLSVDKPISAGPTGRSSLAAILSSDVPISATIAGQSGMASGIVRGRAASAAIAGQSTVAGAPSADVPISAVISAKSTIGANLAADVAVSAVVAGKSHVAAVARKLGEPTTAPCSADVYCSTAVVGSFSR